jgi:hypothetical protein
MAGKRIAVWLISVISAIVVTYILFSYTPIAIPFFEGGFFTVMSVLLAACVFSIPLDILLKARVYDEGGVHFGVFDGGAIAPADSAPGADYKPIVSRDERAKKAQQLAKGK